MDCSALLGVSELFELSITGSQSLSCQVALSVLLGERGQMIVAVNFTAATTLLLSDIASVGPSGDAQTTEEKSQVAFTVVVESVRLVPVGEGACVLTGKWSL